MCPVLLLLLLLAAANSATPPENSTGQNFFVAFPENIAYYHPVQPQNMVQIIALYNDTSVQIIGDPPKSHQIPDILHEGQSKEYKLGEHLELWKSEISEIFLQITSTKPITVHAIYLKYNSVQTALVLPTDKLVKKYFIPPVPRINGTTVPADIVTTNVTERGPFKLIIVNGENYTEVAIVGKKNRTVDLLPRQIHQIWVNEEEKLRSVSASHPVAVLFGHTCAVRHNCTCGLLYAMLPPAKEGNLKFYIPPVVANDTEAFVLVSDEENSAIEAFNPNSPLVEKAGTAILYHPGLLLTLIPETDFATCYVVHTIADAQNSALIVVHKDHTVGVHVGSLPVEDKAWENLKNTDYTSKVVVLEYGKSVIWHTSSKMAVYFIGSKGRARFGNPASIISTTADFRGCVLSPEVLKIGEVANGWRESLEYCRGQKMELVSFPEAHHRKQISEKILQTKNDSLQEVWIGMRRSSQSGEWYWLNGAPVQDTKWEEGEPGTVHDGQCAIMSLEQNKDFGWSDKDCCEAAHPVCYRNPIFFFLK